MSRSAAVRRCLAFAVVSAAVAGCAKASVDSLTGLEAHMVSITPGAPQAGPNGDTVYFAIQNGGVATAYLQPCGDNVLLDPEVYTNGTWQRFGPILDCTVQTIPGPIELDVGAQIVVTSVFPSGRYRMGVYVATTTTLSDVEEAYSIAFTIP